MELIKEAQPLKFYRIDRNAIKVTIHGQYWFTCWEVDIDKIIRTFNSIPKNYNL